MSLRLPKSEKEQAITNPEDKLLRQRRMLADFGDFALQSEDLDEVLMRACALVKEVLETARSKILQINDEGNTLFLRAGAGWDEGVVGSVKLQMVERSSETYSIKARKPVITRDIREEQRFDVPQFMKESGIVALVNVPIYLPAGKAYGLLQVDDTKPRSFDESDIEFLRTYATILGPVVDRLFKMHELEAAEERFRLTVEAASDYAIFVTDRDGIITDWLPGAVEVFGWSSEEAVGKPGSIIFTPEDREAGAPEKELAEARENGVAPDNRWHIRKDESRIFIQGSVRALTHGGAQSGFLKIGQDVTQKRQSDERRKVLLAELQHRTRNLMAVVQSTANKTARNSQNISDFLERFGERLDALNRVQGLLSSLKGFERVTFDELLESELKALGALDAEKGKVVIKGPQSIRLRSSTVQTLALAIHELATNAAKYGALAQPAAKLSVKWWVDRRPDDERPWLCIEWRETGVEMPSAETTSGKGGQGRALIERALPYQLEAETEYEFGEDGVRCTISAPISQQNIKRGRAGDKASAHGSEDSGSGG